jgi:hypothetical protein
MSMMNIKFQHVVSDMEGVSVLRVIGAMASVETGAGKPVDPMDPGRFWKDRATMIKSLKGDCRQGLLTQLGSYRFIIYLLSINYTMHIITYGGLRTFFSLIWQID